MPPITQATLGHFEWPRMVVSQTSTTTTRPQMMIGSEEENIYGTAVSIYGLGLEILVVLSSLSFTAIRQHARRVRR